MRQYIDSNCICSPQAKIFEDFWSNIHDLDSISDLIMKANFRGSIYMNLKTGLSGQN